MRGETSVIIGISTTADLPKILYAQYNLRGGCARFNATVRPLLSFTLTSDYVGTRRI